MTRKLLMQAGDWALYLVSVEGRHWRELIGPSHTDYPVFYPNNMECGHLVAYDFPERIPAHVKEAVLRVRLNGRAPKSYLTKPRQTANVLSGYANRVRKQKENSDHGTRN